MEHELAAKKALFEKLLEHKIVLASSVPGIVGRGPVMRELCTRIEGAIDELCAQDNPERVWFPPVMPREIVRRTGYLENFPHLCGSVHAFAGSERDHAPLLERVKAGEDWGPTFAQTDLVLAPAACYPLYPTQAGTLPAGGKLFDLTGFCFRHEPSEDPARLQSFELRENVRMGSPDDVRDWRAMWMERGQKLLRDLSIDATLATASDPFFGRGGRLMSANQQQMELKFELLVPIWSEASPTAVASFNYHQEHFAHVFGIHAHDGSEAHTACLGFGVDRMAIAMLRKHGLAPSQWPSEVRQKLRIV